jgi:hypothetical protein
MRVARTAAILALVFAACARRPAPVVPALVGRLAVSPFRVGGTFTPEGVFAPGAEPEAGPGEHGVVAARVLSEKLAALGVPVIDPDRVAAAATLVGTARPDVDRARRAGARVGAEFAVVGALARYRQRDGSALAARTPASVAYQLIVVRTADRSVVTSDSFEYTQQPLSENLLDLPMFLRGGGRWMTREEILAAALGASAETIAPALRAVPRPSR